MLDWFKKDKKTTKKDTLIFLKELRLPKMILELFIESDIAKESPLSKYFRFPFELYDMDKKNQEACHMNIFIPILCDMNFYQIYAYDKIRKGFFTYDIEAPNKDWRNDAPRYAWEGIFILDILFWWECEIPNEEIIAWGEMLNLKHTKEILWSIENELENSKPDTTRGWEKRIIRKFKFDQ
ncbi:hypothetical protein [Aureispira sp. CCB-QB1]|uniref:hypothetical protein n=1 Tax=Aureispira sp. CCB-QB1 TaxID=1313421 RepID=UPI0012DF013E|nr:hypothetical protein [Aureispira sp. CCB-QB1]